MTTEEMSISSEKTMTNREIELSETYAAYAKLGGVVNALKFSEKSACMTVARIGFMGPEAVRRAVERYAHK